jgi:hypothetical protein
MYYRPDEVAMTTRLTPPRTPDARPRTIPPRWVYDFAEGSREMRELLGGKGANVAEMTRILGPDRVPAGFTITTEACVAYMNADKSFPDGLDGQVAEALGRLEEQAGRTLGDPEDPLLVSVRSGARESMPGMMDTVLNLGLNDESVEGLARKTENDRFAWDSYRRFVQMYGNVVMGVAGERFEDAIKAVKQDRGVREDTELDVDALKRLTEEFKGFMSSRPIRRSSCRGRSGRCSIRGWVTAPCSTGASTASPTIGARRSTSSRWCSATRSRPAAAAWRSRAMR